MTAMPQKHCNFVTASCGCILALLACNPAEGFIVSTIPSTADSTVLAASRTTRAHVSTPLHRTSFYHALSPLNTNADSPERHHCHVRETGGASRLWMSAGGNDVGSMFSRWRKVAAATAVGLAIFGGGVLMPAPSDTATAGIAPSLMQDEKGYISIFEKVRGKMVQLRCCLHCECI